MPQITPKGIKLFPFQKTGVATIIKYPNLLLADEMGLGKTIQVIAAINYLYAKTKEPKILILCPASLKENWFAELKRWLLLELKVSIATPKGFTLTDIVIINYDIIGKWKPKFPEKWDLIVIDECHYLKNSTTLRTKHVYGWRGGGRPIVADRKLLLSGTPILNYPLEIFTALRYLYPDRFQREVDFRRKFCTPVSARIPIYRKRGGQPLKIVGYRTEVTWTGARATDKLQKLLKGHIMLRRTKAEVLTQLPPKIKQIVELDPANALSHIKKERDLITTLLKKHKLESFTEVRKLLQNVRLKGVGSISALRRKTALLKVPAAAAYISTLLTTVPKVVVFAHHKDAIAKLHAIFSEKSVVITGATPAHRRQELIDKFQNDPGIKVFIGSILASGVGMTLTAAPVAVFLEMDWSPGKNVQAEDRIHRIGQQSSVLIQYLVFPKTLDTYIAHINCDKQVIIDEILG